MPERPKILTRKAVGGSRLFKVEAAELEFSNGERREYEYLIAGEHAAVIVVAMPNDDEFLLVEEYGIGLERYEWALPKGKVDAGEGVLDAANRELQEEAGFGADKLTLITSLSQSPNYMQHQTQVVLARDLFERRLPGDEPEAMRVCSASFENLQAAIFELNITEARTIAALYLVRDWLQSQQLQR